MFRNFAALHGTFTFFFPFTFSFSFFLFWSFLFSFCETIFFQVDLVRKQSKGKRNRKEKIFLVFFLIFFKEVAAVLPSTSTNDLLLSAFEQEVFIPKDILITIFLDFSRIMVQRAKQVCKYEK